MIIKKYCAPKRAKDDNNMQVIEIEYNEWDR